MEYLEVEYLEAFDFGWQSTPVGAVLSSEVPCRFTAWLESREQISAVVDACSLTVTSMMFFMHKMG